jgi:hypothetical protein
MALNSEHDSQMGSKNSSRWEAFDGLRAGCEPLSLAGTAVLGS